MTFSMDVEAIEGCGKVDRRGVCEQFGASLSYLLGSLSKVAQVAARPHCAPEKQPVFRAIPTL
jgi:hypothetical protein